MTCIGGKPDEETLRRIDVSLRLGTRRLILYKNQGGQGIVDIALAKKCYELAREHGKGYEFDIRARENWWVQGGRSQPW